MLNIVIDTNIVISGLLRPGGKPERVLLLFFNHQFNWCVSQEIFDEYNTFDRKRELMLLRKWSYFWEVMTKT